MSEWKSIESAPKDQILLLSDVKWPFAKLRGGAPIKVGGWWDGRWNIWGASWEPTHWAPLPSPPISEEGE